MTTAQKIEFLTQETGCRCPDVVAYALQQANGNLRLALVDLQAELNRQAHDR